MRLRAPLLAAASLAVVVPLAFAAPPTSPASPSTNASSKASTSAASSSSTAVMRPKLTIDRFTLDNGLRVVVCPDDSSPTFTVVVWYDVGSRDEKPGEGGFAHLFEHLMFEGSDTFPRGVHDEVVQSRGGQGNASTSADWTRYFEMMPSGELATTLFLEADRMRSLHVDEEAFENQRKVVEEEYRMRVENVPYRAGFIRLDELVYEGFHPYAHPTIGSMKELDDAKLEWVKAFHTAHYAPNNAVLVIAGDVKTEEARALVHQYFDVVPKSSRIQKLVEPAFSGRTTATGPEVVSDAFARTPGVMMAWNVPREGDPDHYALELAAEVLSGYESARLDRKLVKELGWVRHVSASPQGHRGPDAFIVDATLAADAKIEDVEKTILTTIDELAKNGPTDAEMKKARAHLEHGFLFGLQTNLSRAMELAEFEGARGDARLLEKELDELLAVDATRVKAVVAKYLVREKMAHVRVLPPATSTTTPTPPKTKTSTSTPASKPSIGAVMEATPKPSTSSATPPAPKGNTQAPEAK